MIFDAFGADEPSLAFLRALLLSAPFGFYVVDAELRVIAYNHAAERAFGVSAPIAGRDFAELIHVLWPEPIAADALERFRHTLATGDPYVAPPLTGARKNLGRVESYEWRTQRIQLPDGSYAVACYFYDLTGLREIEARNAFLIAFADAVRPLTSVFDIMFTASRLLAQKLGAGQAAYGHLDDAQEFAVVERDWNDGSVPSNLGRHRIRDFGAAIYEKLRRGEIAAVSDVTRDPLTAPNLAAWNHLAVGATLIVPLVKAERLMAVLVLSCRRAHEWSAADVELAREVAERTWDAAERARVEENLRRTQERLAAALEAGLAGTFFWDISRDRVTTDENMRRYFALSGDATGDGVPIAAIFPAIHEEDRGRVAAAIADAVRAHGVYQAEYRVDHPDGSLRWLSARGVVRRDERGTLAMPGFLADVTRSKEAEIALRASEEKYRTLFESIDEGFGVLELVLDADGQARDCVVLEANPAQETLTGVKGIVGRRVREFLPEQGEPWFEKFARVARTGEPVRFELPLGGTERWLDVHASRVGGESSRQIAVVFNDVTGRKRREANAAFLDDLSDAANAASTAAELVRVVGERAAKFFGAFAVAFVFVNEARGEADVTEAWSGERPLEWAGRYKLADYVSVEFQRLMASGRPMVVRDVTSDGRITDAKKFLAADTRALLNVPLIRGGAWRFALGIYHSQPFAWRADQVALMMEVTARVWNRLERARAEERLRDDDRRKDEFLAVLAHELRNPLAPIRTGLELIQLGGHTPEAVARVRTMMDRQVSHMVRLIDDLLDVSRITSGKIRLQRQPSSLAQLVATAVEASRAALDAGRIQLSVELPREPLVLDVDPTRFVQVLSNILHNAIKFTGAGGFIHVHAEVDGARRLTLSIADSGTGISHEMLPRVFDLFAQGEAPPLGASQGLGIGLALARRLVELHGGTIEAESEGAGRGSRFTIRMPLGETQPAVIEPPPPAPRPLRQRVLVIDDNADAADSTAMLVEALGGECRVAYDGERGLEVVLAFRPDVVLLDLGMPLIDGYETCRRIRSALGRSVAVVAVTGWGQERDKLQALQAGFDRHLTKPVSPQALQRLLGELRPREPAELQPH